MSEEEIIRKLNDKIEYLEEANYMDIDKSDVEVFQGIIDICRWKNKVIERMGIILMSNRNSIFYKMTLEEVENYFYKQVEVEDE